MNTVLPQPSFSKLLTTRETLIAFSTWVCVTVFVVVVTPESEFLASWVVTLPAGWLMYHVSFRWLFPKALTFRFPVLFYGVCVAGYCLAVFFTQALIISIFIEAEDFFLEMGGLTIFTLFFILAPVQWYVFKRMARNNEELFVLRRKLGHSQAGADLLRAQINPHFLFNAFNTLYGLSIHEKAERTSEAIEKLGSMMRFMLMENMQEKILLVRDLEYVDNYIALQRLRTDTNPNIRIQVSIGPAGNGGLMIAPMLLIPFIENAFKHGISLREESLIRISLEVKDSILYFDVFNNRHIRPEGDPEKNSHGIGLANVKQRLQLMYPGKHELVIRETVQDYFIHLVVTLA